MESIQKLKYKWALWETYVQSNDSNFKNLSHAAYMENNNMISEVDNLEEFTILWANLPHSQPAQFFHEHEQRYIKKVRISEHQVKQIDSVAFFKHDIKPAWEDPQNANGGEFQLKLVDPYPQEINNLWEALVFDLMSGDLEMSERITGIRIVDKSRPPRNNTRLEVWVDFKEESLRKQLEQILVEKYCKSDLLGDKLQPKPEWKDHSH